MIECHRCGDSVLGVRNADVKPTQTDGLSRWLCADCETETETLNRDDSVSSGLDASPKTAVTDGGTTPCPDCSSTTVNVHGIIDCVACNWSTS